MNKRKSYPVLVLKNKYVLCRLLSLTMKKILFSIFNSYISKHCYKTFVVEQVNIELSSRKEAKILIPNQK